MGQGCRFGRCAAKAVKTYLGRSVPCPGGLREPRGSLTAVQKSAEGIVGGGHEPDIRKPHPTEGPNGPRKGINRVATRTYDS